MSVRTSSSSRQCCRLGSTTSPTRTCLMRTLSNFKCAWADSVRALGRPCLSWLAKCSNACFKTKGRVNIFSTKLWNLVYIYCIFKSQSIYDWYKDYMALQGIWLPVMGRVRHISASKAWYRPDMARHSAKSLPHSRKPSPTIYLFGGFTDVVSYICCTWCDGLSSI